MAKQFLESVAALSLLAGGFMAFSSAAEAAVIQFDDEMINGGTLFYDGEGGPLMGTDLLLDLVMGIDTPLNSGESGGLLCEDCKLNLKTGANLSEFPYQFDSEGSSLTITGTVKNGETEIATGTLVTGSFTETVIGSANGDAVVFTSIGLDTMDAGISAFFGIDATKFRFAQTSIAIGDVELLTDQENEENEELLLNGGFIGTVTNVDMDNFPIEPEENPPIGPEENTPVSVPEPATLLGLGVVGAALGVSRRCSMTKK